MITTISISFRDCTITEANQAMSEIQSRLADLENIDLCGKFISTLYESEPAAVFSIPK